ncbi:hypothetical protein GC209_02380 [bacterium]|nr:hypothetical protein [bacterium]
MPSASDRQNDLHPLHPVVRQAVGNVMADIEAAGLPFRVFESFRSPERQRLLYAQGRTSPGPIVTKAKPWTSYHQYGLAADFVLFVNGNWSWETGGAFADHWTRLHEIGRRHGLEPLSWEQPHLQLAGTGIATLMAGKYPDGGDSDWADALRSAIDGWTGVEPAPPPPVVSGRPAIAVDLATEADVVVQPGPSSADTDLVERPEVGLTAAIIEGAQASERLWLVPTSVTLAQFILESGGGAHMPPGSNNPFGIKARAGEPFVDAMTWEVVNGAKVRGSARFRKFTSFAEAFSQHGRLLATAAPYRAVMALRNDPMAFARALTGIYATDPSYGTKLTQLMTKYALTSYDIAGKAEADAPTGAPAPAEPAPAAKEENSDLMFGMSGEAVRSLQVALTGLGYPLGAVDGKFGSLTRAALLAFQADNGLPLTATVNAATWAKLNVAPHRVLDSARLAATEADLKDAGSRTVTEGANVRTLGTVTGLLGALGIGNSAFVNAAGTTTPATADMAPVRAFLGHLQQVLASTATPNAADLAGILDQARALAQQLGSTVSPDLAKIAGELQTVITPQLAGRYPDLASLLGQLASALPQKSQLATTVFDLLPGMTAPGSNLETVAQILATVASSIIPGFGGSVAAIGLGLLAHGFGKKIVAARLEDHRDGKNIGA